MQQSLICGVPPLWPHTVTRIQVQPRHSDNLDVTGERGLASANNRWQKRNEVTIMDDAAQEICHG